MLDLLSNEFTPIKTAVSPRPREGHSMVVYKNSLITFGGCESSEQPPFKDVWAFDIINKTWDRSKTKGKKPEGRDGHAAGTIKSLMIVYGGSGYNKLFGDIYALNLCNNQ